MTDLFYNGKFVSLDSLHPLSLLQPLPLVTIHLLPVLVNRSFLWLSTFALRFYILSVFLKLGQTSLSPLDSVLTQLFLGAPVTSPGESIQFPPYTMDHSLFTHSCLPC